MTLSTEDRVMLDQLIIDSERSGDAIREKMEKQDQVDLAELHRLANHMKNSADMVLLRLQWLWSLSLVEKDLPDKYRYE